MGILTWYSKCTGCPAAMSTSVEVLGFTVIEAGFTVVVIFSSAKTLVGATGVITPPQASVTKNLILLVLEVSITGADVQPGILV